MFDFEIRMFDFGFFFWDYTDCFMITPILKVDGF